jgi:hypothetical protein
MIKLPLLLVHFLSVLSASPEMKLEPVLTSVPEIPSAESMYKECGLAGEIGADVFAAAISKLDQHGIETRIIAVADMTQPSDARRLYLIDLQERKLLKRTYVAHGQKSGELKATSFSNVDGSHQTSLGLYRIGQEIVSPKHGAALLLYGLDKGMNCQAQQREIIMHGADYVSEDFIKKQGRLGRSWGCPAVSRADMPEMIELLAGTGVLYIHG